MGLTQISGNEGRARVYATSRAGFLCFLAVHGHWRSRLHGELYDANYWKGRQATIRKGKVIDVFAYRRKER